MRKQFLFIGSVIILILSIFTFIVFGVGSEVFTAIFGGKGQLPPFGSYNGKPIELSQGTEFANAVSQYSDMYKNQGQQLDESAYFYIYSYAFNATVTTMAYIDAVTKADFSAGEKAVNRALIPYYSDANGKFSQKIYNSVAESDRESLRKDVTRNILYRRYYEDVFGSSDTVGKNHLFGLKSSDAELSFLNTMGSKQRSFDMVSFDTTTYPDSEVLAYGNKNADLFTKYDLSAVTLKDQDKANSLLSQLQKKEVTFKDAVSNFSEKYYTDNDGKFSDSYLYRMKGVIPSESDQKEVLSLAKDAISGVVKTANGYTIFRCDGDTTKADFTDKKTLDIVRKYITSNEAGTVEDYFTGVAKNFTAAAVSDGFEKACKTFNVTEKTVPAFPLNYGNNSLLGKVPSDTIPELANAATNENFFKTAFSLHTGEVSSPIVIDKYVVVLKLTGEQTDTTNDEAKSNSIASDLATIDQSSGQVTLFASKKIVNNVSTVFFNHILSQNKQTTGKASN